MATLTGASIVGLSGLTTGGGSFPIKLMRKFEFEHFFFVASLVTLFVIPWSVTLLSCPNVIAAFQSIDPTVLLKANAFSLTFSIADILITMCFIRIGFVLTGGISIGLGAAVGITMPLIVKGSGLFADAPDLGSMAGRLILVGVAILLAGVVLISFAGFGRERVLNQRQERSGSFVVGLIMVIIGAICAAGLSFSFVYSQGPIVQAMKEQGAGDIASIFAVWAIALFAGGISSLLYPAYLMTRKKSWHILAESPREMGWSILMGTFGCLGIALSGKGMILLGPLGASVGFGIRQSMVMLGNMGVGFVDGEWRGIRGTPIVQLYLGIAFLLIATIVLAYANNLA